MCAVQMTATQLFNRRKGESEAAKMIAESRRLEEQAAAQAAARRQNEGQLDADSTKSGVVDSEVDTLAMRRKVDREREAAAIKIQKLARR